MNDKHQKFLNSARNFSLQFLLVVVSLIYVLPFYVVAILALKTPEQALYNPMAFPTTIHYRNFIEAWSLMKYHIAFLNTLSITVVSVLLTVLFSGMAGFVLTRGNTKIYRWFYYFFVSGIIVPLYVILNPVMKLIKDLHLMDHKLGIICIYLGLGLPFAIFLYVGFLRTIPMEITDAGIIDGCSPFQLYWLILFPMLKHVTITLVILYALWFWNDFLIPLLLFQRLQNRTIMVAQHIFQGMYSNRWNLSFASYILCMTPLLVVFFSLQKFIVKGMTAGALKG